eukprot:snap_masked-scaffold_5-processed-gene-14.24-mRNA-1 protein AED:1.00 eAED:1.00 QI:0/0/0/0/1/1/2/0/79
MKENVSHYISSNDNVIEKIPGGVFENIFNVVLVPLQGNCFNIVMFSQVGMNGEGIKQTKTKKKQNKKANQKKQKVKSKV